MNGKNIHVLCLILKDGEKYKTFTVNVQKMIQNDHESHLYSFFWSHKRAGALITRGALNTENTVFYLVFIFVDFSRPQRIKSEIRFGENEVFFYQVNHFPGFAFIRLSLFCQVVR